MFSGNRDTTISPVFLPYYVFDFNSKNLDTNEVKMHQNVPIYAGYTYRRVLANQIHSDLLSSASLSKLTTDFRSSFLDPLPPPTTGPPLEVFVRSLPTTRATPAPSANSLARTQPDPWSAHRAVCWDAARYEISEADEGRTSFELISATRVYLPACACIPNQRPDDNLTN
jgi:hypothetical protein